MRRKGSFSLSSLPLFITVFCCISVHTPQAQFIHKPLKVQLEQNSNRPALIRQYAHTIALGDLNRDGFIDHRHRKHQPDHNQCSMGAN